VLLPSHERRWSADQTNRLTLVNDLFVVKTPFHGQSVSLARALHLLYSICSTTTVKEEGLMRKRMLVLVLTVVSSAAAPSQCGAEDRYYMIMFASQAEPNLPKHAHTFAVFVKASHEGKDPSKHKIESHCISWLPKSLTIDPLRLQPEPGENLSLPASLKFAKANNAQVTMWGPFLIQKKCYDMALKRLEYLNSGKIAYVVFDRRFRGGQATNCIHAVSDLDLEQPLVLTGTAHGEAASRMVLQHLEKWVVSSRDDVSWLVDRLSLSKEQVRFVPRDKSAKR
jgi:hypothetical protein